MRYKTVTEQEISAKMAGNILMYEGSPRVRIGDEIHLLVDKQEEVRKALQKQVNRDRCGIVIAGETADSLRWEDQTDFRIILEAMRDVLYENPTPEQVIAGLRAKNPDLAHPRLLLNREKVKILREKVRTAEPHKSWMAKVIEKAEEALKAPEPKYELRDGIRLLDVSREVLLYIENMAFAYLMTEQPRYAEGVVKVLMHVCGDAFPDWHPHHFLDTAELAEAVALGYDWCYDVLTAEQRTIVKNAIVEKALKPVLEDYHEVEGRKRTWYWSSKSSSAYPQNWVAVCFGGTVSAALAIGDEDLGEFTEAGNVITEGMERVKDYLCSFMPDGGCGEGIGYWEFAMKYLAFGIGSMEVALGTDYGLGSSPGLKNAFTWLAQMMGPVESFNALAVHKGYIGSSAYFWYGAKEGNGALTRHRMEKQLGEWGLGTTYRDIIWYEEPEEDSEKVGLGLQYVSRNNVGVVILRSGYEKEDVWFAMYTGSMEKAVGTDGENDGTFVLDMQGLRWAVALGEDNAIYRLLEHPRYHLYRHRAESSNTVIIEPGDGYDHKPDSYGVCNLFESDENGARVVYDFTAELAYKGAKSWKRSAALDRKTQKVTIGDTLIAEKPVEYYWFMHTDAEIMLSEDRRRVVLTKKGKQIEMKLRVKEVRFGTQSAADPAEDQSLRFEIMEAAPLPTSPNPPGQASNAGVKKLAVHGMDVEMVDMEVEFTPL